MLSFKKFMSSLQVHRYNLRVASLPLFLSLSSLETTSGVLCPVGCLQLNYPSIASHA